MNKREAILFLEKKRDKAIGDMSFFGEGSRKGLMNEIRVNTYDIAINTVQQIDEPIDTLAQEYDVEPDTIREWLDRGHAGSFEKVVVSQEFADWVEKAMVYQVMTKEWCLKEIANMGWADWLHDPQNGEKYPCDNHWSCEVSENKEKHIKAIYDGYTVKPKRWVVKDSDGEYVYDLHLCHIDTTAHSSNTTQFDILTFTNHAKAEAVATLIEGSVEEV
ncbi:DUF1642 domain-containing protein [Enterococcus asini]|uniref:DUF1642 domain-containing protein n=1 Tax=Enterococcus asini TaxID=57732 RepID=UPI0028925AB3|nr:DUF1642 domain-containing protein [Enterococcus asini]MDT2756956.1 DUF1642 domain-containing protein [Enterococcus asini]